MAVETKGSDTLAQKPPTATNPQLIQSSCEYDKNCLEGYAAVDMATYRLL
jgi:hypothetical protein